MKNNFIFYIYILLICSCENKSSTSLSTTKEALYTISLDEAIEDNEFSFEKFNSNFRYVQLETKTESLLANIVFLGLLNDTIVVRDDADQIMSFTNNGKFIGRIGKEGGGPLEYNGIKSFFLDRKAGHAIVVDYGLRVLRYDLRGNLTASYTLNDEVVRARPDNSLFSNNYIFNFYRASTRNPHAHSYYGINDSLKSSFINPNPMYKCIASAWSQNPLTQLDDTIVFVKPLSDTIFQFTDGNITPRFVFRHKEPSLPQSKIDFYNDSEKELNYDSFLTEQLENGHFVGFENIFETKHFLIFSLNIKGNYIFDKSTHLLYKINGFKDLGVRDVFNFKQNSDRNSLIALASASYIIGRQEILQEKKDERIKIYRNPPPEYERLILDFEEENNPIVIIATFGE